MKKRLFTGVVGAALLVPALTACGGGDAQAFCDKIQDQDIDGTDPDAMAQAMEELQDEAPSEISDDVDLMVEAFNQLQEDPASVEDMDEEELMAASDRLTEWEQENCETDSN